MNAPVMPKPDATPVMGTAPATRPNGLYMLNRCGGCVDIHLALFSKHVIVRQDGLGVSSVSMSNAEARQLAAELLELAEGH